MVAGNDSLPITDIEQEDGSILGEALIDERRFQVERFYGINKIYIGYGKENIEIYKSKEADQTIIFWYEDEPGC